ncbi:unnamed protein product [Allacma fusca]|uniref:SCP domain-containing protein n=1 Tax=Allacma fusca TaxID=39272 RepID=A0A8J2PFN1_9HEXA|nr:unnamed protein product [Allacma fusca]
MNLITFVFLILVSASAYQPIWYEDIALDRHNIYRRMHDYADLEYSDTLGALALMCAKYYSKIHKIDHSCIYKFLHGENLAFFGRNTGAPEALDSLVDAIDGWYAESYDYDYEQPQSSTSAEIYHFTQMIWNSTFQMGFGIFRNYTSKRTYVVALYEPKGNILIRPPDSFKWFRGNVTAPVMSFQNQDYDMY